MSRTTPGARRQPTPHRTMSWRRTAPARRRTFLHAHAGFGSSHRPVDHAHRRQRPVLRLCSVSFTLGDGNDGSGSGLDTSSRTVTRESASLTGDSCGSFTADAGTYSSPDTSVSNGNCYRYSFTITDNVGNTSSSVTATAKVDTQAPNVSLSAPTELTGAGNQYYDGATKTQFFRPAGSGSFRLNATASDSETAVASVSFPDISGLSGWSGSTGGVDTTSPYSSPADYTWSSGAVEPGARNISGSDKAANSTSDTITLTADSTAPTGQSLTLTGANAPYYGAASVSFSFADGNDGSGSGLDLSTRSITRETGDLVAGACSNFTPTPAASPARTPPSRAVTATATRSRSPTGSATSRRPSRRPRRSTPTRRASP